MVDDNLVKNVTVSAYDMLSSGRASTTWGGDPVMVLKISLDESS